jgi:hypothetical protein
MAKHLEDFGKDAKDLLSQDFISDGTIKITTQSKNSENVTMKSTLSRVIKKDKFVREIISATFEPKYEDKVNNYDINGKITSNNEYNGTLVLKDYIGSGSKMEININKTTETIAVSPTVSIKTDTIAGKAKLNYPLSSVKKSPVKFITEGSFFIAPFLAGLGTTFTMDTPKAAIDIEAVVAYEEKNSQAAFRAKHTLQSSLISFALSYFYKQPDAKTTYAIEGNTDSTFEKFDISLGGDLKCDKYTTLKAKGVLKHSKKDTEIRSALALKQQICPSLLASFGVDLNLPLLLGQDLGEPHSFGVELKFDNK